MLKTLLRKQMTEIFRTYFYDARKSKPRSKASTIFLFVMFGVLMIGVLDVRFPCVQPLPPARCRRA